MIRTSRLLVASLGLLGLLLPGCVSTGMARTLDQGQFQATLAPGVQGNMAFDSQGPSSPGVSMPQSELGLRYGVTDRVDVGARLFLPGVGVDARFGLLRAPSLHSGLDVTLAPSLLYFLNFNRWDQGLMMLELPLLVGINLGGSQLVFGPRAGYAVNLGVSSVSPTRSVLVGSSLGVAIPLAHWLRIVPEVTVRLPPREGGTQQMLYQGGIGLLFGGYAKP